MVCSLQFLYQRKYPRSQYNPIRRLLCCQCIWFVWHAWQCFRMVQRLVWNLSYHTTNQSYGSFNGLFSCVSWRRLGRRPSGLPLSVSLRQQPTQLPLFRVSCGLTLVSFLAYKIYNTVKDNLAKTNHQGITIKEHCEYEGFYFMIHQCQEIL